MNTHVSFESSRGSVSGVELGTGQRTHDMVIITSNLGAVALDDMRYMLNRINHDQTLADAKAQAPPAVDVAMLADIKAA